MIKKDTIVTKGNLELINANASVSNHDIRIRRSSQINPNNNGRSLYKVLSSDDWNIVECNKGNSD